MLLKRVNTFFPVFFVGVRRPVQTQFLYLIITNRIEIFLHYWFLLIAATIRSKETRSLWFTRFRWFTCCVRIQQCARSLRETSEGTWVPLSICVCISNAGRKNLIWLTENIVVRASAEWCATYCVRVPFEFANAVSTQIGSDTFTGTVCRKVWKPFWHVQTGIGQLWRNGFARRPEPQCFQQTMYLYWKYFNDSA